MVVTRKPNFLSVFVVVGFDLLAVVVSLNPYFFVCVTVVVFDFLAMVGKTTL